MTQNDTRQEVAFEHDAKVTLLPFTSALPQLRRDLEDKSPVAIWTYLIDPDFFRDVFAAHLTHSPLLLLGDNRQRTTLIQLAATYRLLHSATWSSNRTMHDKTILFPKLNVTYLTTSNITRGAWTMSMNSTARIVSPSLTNHIEAEFHATWDTARPVLRPLAIK